MSKLQTAGDLREFLAFTIMGVKNGDIPVDKANVIVKGAEQITNSLYGEIKQQQIQLSAGLPHYKIGQLPLNDSESKNVPEGEK